MDRREAMLSLRSKLLAEHPEITSAYELGPWMGELTQEYWRWQLECGFAEEIRLPVTVNVPPSSSVDEGNTPDE